MLGTYLHADYWHTVSDVCVGLGLGFGISLLAYLKLFPFFTHVCMTCMSVLRAVKLLSCCCVQELCDVPMYQHQAERMRMASRQSLTPPHADIEM